MKMSSQQFVAHLGEHQQPSQYDPHAVVSMSTTLDSAYGKEAWIAEARIAADHRTPYKSKAEAKAKLVGQLRALADKLESSQD